MEYGLDALALRCWTELQTQLGISPCVLLGALNQTNFAAACELDSGSAITMHALGLASGQPAACLDWNNNYGEDENKCILFHCGPVPPTMMAGKGQIIDHEILATAIGKGRAYGPNVGRIRPMDMTFSNMLTQDGRLRFYLGQGRITADPIPEDFFGVAGVAEIEKMQELFLYMGKVGHRHHVALTQGFCAEPMQEALSYYLGYEAAMHPQA